MKELNELTERMDSNDEIIDNLVKKTIELEKQVMKTPEIIIPDYSTELNTIINELRNINQEDKVNQLFSMVTSISERLEKQPASVNKQFRILLFPETNTTQYYKLVFGRLIPSLFALIVLLSAISLGKQVIAKWKVQSDNEQADKYVKAWDYLNEHGDKKVKKQMNQALKNTEN